MNKQSQLDRFLVVTSQYSDSPALIPIDNITLIADETIYTKEGKKCFPHIKFTSNGKDFSMCVLETTEELIRQLHEKTWSKVNV